MRPLVFFALALFLASYGAAQATGEMRQEQTERKWVRLKIGGSDYSIELYGPLREIQRDPMEVKDVSDEICEFRFIDSRLIVRAAIMSTSLDIEPEEPSLKMVSDGLLMDFLSSLTAVEGAPGELVEINGLPTYRGYMDFEHQGRELGMRSVLMLNGHELVFVLAVYRRGDETGLNMARRITDSLRFEALPSWR